MSQLISENAIAFGADDPTVQSGFETYNKSKDFNKLKPFFYAVMLHGNHSGVFVPGDYDPFEFAPILTNCYKKYGKGRVVLLVSCLVGWAFARPLASRTQIPIVAGLSDVAFETEFSKGKSRNFLSVLDADGIKLNDKLTGENHSGMKFRPEWRFYYPSGFFETIPGGKYLNQDEAILRAKKYMKVR